MNFPVPAFASSVSQRPHPGDLNTCQNIQTGPMKTNIQPARTAEKTKCRNLTRFAPASHSRLLRVNPLRDQVLVLESLVVHAAHQMGHLFERIHLPNVVPIRELLDVAVKVFGGELVERALVRPLQHAPEGLDIQIPGKSSRIFMGILLLQRNIYTVAY